MRAPLPSPTTDCCGTPIPPWTNEVREGLCSDCMDCVCTACAAVWEDDYSLEGDPGEYRWCGFVRCGPCQAGLCWNCRKGQRAGAAGLCQACNDEADAEADREYRRQMRDWRNDSGV
jgi:hypothetical protein